MEKVDRVLLEVCQSFEAEKYKMVSQCCKTVVIIKYGSSSIHINRAFRLCEVDWIALNFR